MRLNCTQGDFESGDVSSDTLSSLFQPVILKIIFLLDKQVCARIEKRVFFFYCVELNKIKFNAIIFTATFITDSSSLPQRCLKKKKKTFSNYHIKKHQMSLLPPRRIL